VERTGAKSYLSRLLIPNKSRLSDCGRFRICIARPPRIELPPSPLRVLGGAFGRLLALPASELLSVHAPVSRGEKEQGRAPLSANFLHCRVIIAPLLISTLSHRFGESECDSESRFSLLHFRECRCTPCPYRRRFVSLPRIET